MDGSFLLGLIFSSDLQVGLIMGFNSLQFLGIDFQPRLDAFFVYLGDMKLLASESVAPKTNSGVVYRVSQILVLFSS